MTSLSGEGVFKRLPSKVTPERNVCSGKACFRKIFFKRLALQRQKPPDGKERRENKRNPNLMPKKRSISKDRFQMKPYQTLSFSICHSENTPFTRLHKHITWCKSNTFFKPAGTFQAWISTGEGENTAGWFKQSICFTM